MGIALNRESYTSTHILLNLLNLLPKSDKMHGITFLQQKFNNQYNTTGAQILDSIYDMT